MKHYFVRNRGLIFVDLFLSAFGRFRHIVKLASDHMLAALFQFVRLFTDSISHGVLDLISLSAGLRDGVLDSIGRAVTQVHRAIFAR